MFRDRPLIWLFVIATVCVDLVWFLTTKEDEFGVTSGLSDSLFVKFGFIGCWLAQASALAIYTVSSQGKLLTKASVLVAGNFILAFLSYPGFNTENRTWLGFFCIHSLCAICLVTIVRLKQLTRIEFKESLSFRISLVEMFGWTIVVAILSFCYRYLNFQDLDSTGCAVILLPSVLLNGATIWGLSTKSALPVVIRVMSPVLIALLSLLVFRLVFQGEKIRDAIGLFGGYSSYLCLSVIVCRIDRKSASEKLVPIAIEA